VEQRLIAGRYELREPLGGSSWLATDTELGRDVLVQLGRTGSTGATPLSHESIARVFDHGEADGEHFVVREYLPGGSLGERGASSLSETDAHTAARDVAAALAYAHEQGVAHGALNEANVLFDAEGRAKIADFAGVGEPQDDVRAFGGILQSLATAAPALAPAAAAALAGELDSAELLARVEDIVVPAPAVSEPTTLIVLPPHAAPPARRRSVVAALAVLAALLAAGIGAAYLATSGGSETNEPTQESPGVPASTEASTSETDAPPPATTADTTEATTTGTTTARTSTARATTAPPSATTEPPPTTAPPPTTEPPATTEPPPTTTEPPPTETEEPPPTTTEGTTTEAG
jgi:eukaryotic-like serine/threonine-protein kinase